MLCFPQEAQPNAAMDIAAIAKRFGSTQLQMQDWIDRGLPVDADGHVDPFVCSNWLSWNCLDEARALKRLWRQFTALFRPFQTGTDLGRHIQWQRRAQVFLPESIQSYQWFVPDIQNDFSWQQSRRLGDCVAENARVTDCQAYWEICGSDARPTCQVNYDLDIEAQAPLDASDGDYQQLFEIMCTVVEGFTYEYRIHELADRPDLLTQRGTCLDVALQAAAVFEQAGRGWRICGGVIAHSALMNPHHWLEVETRGGRWLPFDASIPAIIRMLGEDWLPWARRYCGGLDSARIAMTRGPGRWNLPDGNFVSAATGAIIATDSGAQVYNAWPCIDWVNGECDGLIERK